MSGLTIHYADRHELAARCGRKKFKVSTVDLHAVSCMGCKRALEPVNEDEEVESWE